MLHLTISNNYIQFCYIKWSLIISNRLKKYDNYNFHVWLNGVFVKELFYAWIKHKFYYMICHLWKLINHLNLITLLVILLLVYLFDVDNVLYIIKKIQWPNKFLDKHVYLIVEGTKMLCKWVWDLPLCLWRSNAWLSVWGGFTIAKWQFILFFLKTTFFTISCFLIFIRITNFVIFESTLLYNFVKK